MRELPFVQVRAHASPGPSGRQPDECAQARGALGPESVEERCDTVLVRDRSRVPAAWSDQAGSVREYGLVRSGFLREGFLGEVMQDSFVEGGESVELGGSEQVDEMPSDVVHV